MKGEEQAMEEYRKKWRSYRLRVWTTVAAWVVPPVLIYLSGVGGKAWVILVCTWLLLFTASMMWLYSFRCPRCREWFFIQFPTNHPLAKVCVHCGLPKHTATDPQEAEPGN